MASVSTGHVPKPRPPVTSFDTWVVGGNTFHVNSGYDLVKAIGAGAYGFVCAARDQHTGDRVAIKKISQAFRHLTDAKRVLRELKILRHFHHENVISIRDILLPRSLKRYAPRSFPICAPTGPGGLPGAICAPARLPASPWTAGVGRAASLCAPPFWCAPRAPSGHACPDAAVFCSPFCPVSTTSML